MDSVLSPREIQTRIRSGASLEDVVAAAGMPADRVERFAAPVLAEREHVAAQAGSASIRRRGETSGHRTLRAVLSDRLRSRGLDADAATWDSYRLETGRWAVVVSYEVDGESRQAVFHFDPQGRFSVAADEQARWLVGEATPGAVVPPTPDTEPTIDLSDELAIVRAIQERPPVPAAETAEEELLASVQPIRPVATAAAPVAQASEASDGTERAEAATAEGSGQRSASGPSAIATLYEMLGYEPLGGDGYSEDSPRVYEGLSEARASEPSGGRADRAGSPADTTTSHTTTAAPAEGSGADAVAIPEAAAGRGAGWEPAIVVAYPVEPGVSEDGESLEVEVPEASDDPGRAEPPVAIEDRHTEAEALEDEQEEQDEQRTAAGGFAPAADAADRGDAVAQESDTLVDSPTPAAAPKPAAGRRRRASVPSWDEIMFGGPKKP